MLARLVNTGWFPVRDGTKVNRAVIEDWVHVEFDGSKGGSIVIQCKVRKGVRYALRGVRHSHIRGAFPPPSGLVVRRRTTRESPLVLCHVEVMKASGKEHDGQYWLMFTPMYTRKMMLLQSAGKLASASVHVSNLLLCSSTPCVSPRHEISIMAYPREKSRGSAITAHSRVSTTVPFLSVSVSLPSTFPASPPPPPSLTSLSQVVLRIVVHSALNCLQHPRNIYCRNLFNIVDTHSLLANGTSNVRHL